MKKPSALTIGATIYVAIFISVALYLAISSNEKLQPALDIATSFSIIAAVFAFILNNKIENKKEAEAYSLEKEKDRQARIIASKLNSLGAIYSSAIEMQTNLNNSIMSLTEAVSALSFWNACYQKEYVTDGADINESDETYKMLESTHENFMRGRTISTAVDRDFSFDFHSVIFELNEISKFLENNIHKNPFNKWAISVESFRLIESKVNEISKIVHNPHLGSYRLKDMNDEIPPVYATFLPCVESIEGILDSAVMIEHEIEEIIAIIFEDVEKNLNL